jgi:two-component system, OmpR family, sensor histidine kinase KdpD
VLVNLLDNAAKYTQAGTLVRITARREEDLVAIDIADEGPGIPAGDLDRIFDKFYRVNDEDRRRAGTGLGLAICRGFMHAMGGRLTVQNRRDRCGAVFTVTLPIGASSTHGMKPDE